MSTSVSFSLRQNILHAHSASAAVPICVCVRHLSGSGANVVDERGGNRKQSLVSLHKSPMSCLNLCVICWRFRGGVKINATHINTAHGRYPPNARTACVRCNYILLFRAEYISLLAQCNDGDHLALPPMLKCDSSAGAGAGTRAHTQTPGM